MSLADDGHTYGFSKHDAEQLANAIGGGDVEFNDRFTMPGGRNTGGVTLYGFTLSSAGFMTTATATATIYALGTAAFGSSIETGVNIYDPSGWALGLPSGSSGLCVKQSGYYYAIQAACPPAE